MRNQTEQKEFERESRLGESTELKELEKAGESELRPTGDLQETSRDLQQSLGKAG